MPLSPKTPLLAFVRGANSPFSDRICCYLALRGIPFQQCQQPPVMPRPDLEKLGIKYRRIPLLAFGRDVYADTRLILEKLEASSAIDTPRLSPATLTPEQRAISHLLESHVMEGGVFLAGVAVALASAPGPMPEAFVQDRARFAGWDASAFSKETLMEGKAEGVIEIKKTLDFLETVLLADGRDWLLGTERPSMGDIHVAWVFRWLKMSPFGGLPEDMFSAKVFPKTFAWLDKFNAAVATAEAALPPVEDIPGDKAMETVLAADFAEDECQVDGGNATVTQYGLKKGDLVTFWPTDTGFEAKDQGKLVGIDDSEVVIETVAEGGQTVRLHAPRHGFKVVPVKA